MSRCVYCNKVLDSNSTSSEHIIPQGLGGLLESAIICCKDCNSKLGSTIDADFVKIFNPIISRFNITKSRGKSSNVGYDGIVKDSNGIVYKGCFKGDTLRTIRDLQSNEFINHIKKNDLGNYKVVSLSINMDKNKFLYGLKKIAFNYAIMCGVNVKNLNSIFNPSSNELKEDESIVIPFIPMNFFDECLELNAPTSLIHSLILFSYEKNLYVFINLFNTFQYYVLLSDSYNHYIYNNYCQILNKRKIHKNKLKEELKIRSYKDAHILASQYNISLDNSFEKIEHYVFEEIRKKEYEVDYKSWVHDKYSNIDIGNLLLDNSNTPEKKINDLLAFNFYHEIENGFDDETGYELYNESIDMERFRILTPIQNEHIPQLYPKLISNTLNNNSTNLFGSYFKKKLDKLGEYLNINFIIK